MLEDELDVFCRRTLVTTHDLLGTTHFGRELGVLQELVNLLDSCWGWRLPGRHRRLRRLVHHLGKVRREGPTITGLPSAAGSIMSLPC